MTNYGKVNLLSMQQNAQFLQQKVGELVAIAVLEGKIDPGVLKSYSITIEEVSSVLLNNLRLLKEAEGKSNDAKPNYDTDTAGAA